MSERLTLTPRHERLLRVCRACTRGWLNRRIALTVRRYLLPRLPSRFVATVEGITLEFHLDDNISERRLFFMPGFFDPEEFALIASHLPRDGVFVDIGANVGIYSLRAARSLGPRGRIVAFEPNPVVIERFRKNLRLNRLEPAVHLLAEGVAETASTFALYLDPTNLGGSSLLADGRADGRLIDVPCRPLLESLNALDIEKIDILKIDVEGAEPRALGPFFADAPCSLWPSWLIMERSDPRWDPGFLPGLFERGYITRATTRANYILERQISISR